MACRWQTVLFSLLLLIPVVSSIDRDHKLVSSRRVFPKVNIESSVLAKPRSLLRQNIRPYILQSIMYLILPAVFDRGAHVWGKSVFRQANDMACTRLP